MQLLAVSGLACRMVRVGLVTGFFVAIVGCDANVDPSATPEPREKEAVARTSSPIVPTQANDSLDGFEQSLKRRFDRSRVVARELPGGGVLHVPNGHADHVAILVKGPDGKLRRECVSSSAEVATVMKRLREGGNP
jgi:hypothetical protein